MISANLDKLDKLSANGEPPYKMDWDYCRISFLDTYTFLYRNDAANSNWLMKLKFAQ